MNFHIFLLTRRCDLLIVYAIFYHLLDYYTVKNVNMQVEKGEKRAEVQKVKLNRRKRNLNQHKGGREKMSNGEHEIRTPKGLRIGNRSVVDGKNMLQIKRGGCEDYISAESLVECIHGLPVKSIEFFTAENQRKEA